MPGEKGRRFDQWGSARLSGEEWPQEEGSAPEAGIKLTPVDPQQKAPGSSESEESTPDEDWEELDRASDEKLRLERRERAARILTTILPLYVTGAIDELEVRVWRNGHLEIVVRND